MRATSLRFRLAVKRALDILVAGVCLVLFSPLLVAIGLILAVTTGRPVLFRQTRLGHHGHPFELLKFRTMTDDRDDRGILLADGERLTPIGRFLRQWSLDELPELLNVIKGEMSMVGPRPLLPEYWDLYSSRQRRRHEMPPGMAGPVPARGRNSLSWGEKFELDVWYVDNWSLRLDFVTFVATLWKAFRREGISAGDHATMPRFEGTSATADEHGSSN